MKVLLDSEAGGQNTGAGNGTPAPLPSEAKWYGIAKRKKLEKTFVKSTQSQSHKRLVCGNRNWRLPLMCNWLNRTRSLVILEASSRKVATVVVETFF